MALSLPTELTAALTYTLLGGILFVMPLFGPSLPPTPASSGSGSADGREKGSFMLEFREQQAALLRLCKTVRNAYM
jgi:hypothetical protein